MVPALVGHVKIRRQMANLQRLVHNHDSLV